MAGWRKKWFSVADTIAGKEKGKPWVTVGDSGMTQESSPPSAQLTKATLAASGSRATFFLERKGPGKRSESRAHLKTR